MEHILEEAKRISAEITEWRRHLHQTPELGLETPKTFSPEPEQADREKSSPASSKTATRRFESFIIPPFCFSSGRLYHNSYR